MVIESINILFIDKSGVNFLNKDGPRINTVKSIVFDSGNIKKLKKSVLIF